MYNPAHRFALPYLVDNGQLRGWPTAHEPDCILVHWHDDDDYSILDRNDKPLGWGETPEDAISSAQYVLQERRRLADGVVPACIA